MEILMRQGFVLTLLASSALVQAMLSHCAHLAHFQTGTVTLMQLTQRWGHYTMGTGTLACATGCDTT